jgi:MFS family permease
MAPTACCIIAGAMLSGRLSRRVAPRPLLVTGTLLAGVALAWISQAGQGGSFAGRLLAPAMIIGLGIGLSMPPLTIAAMSGLGRGRQGLGSGLLNASRQVGSVITVASLTSVAAVRAAGTAPASPAQLGAGYDRAFLGAAVLMAAGAAVAFLLPRPLAGPEGGPDRDHPEGAPGRDYAAGHSG